MPTNRDQIHLLNYYVYLLTPGNPFGQKERQSMSSPIAVRWKWHA